MFVAASSRCFPNLPVKDSLSKLADLEYTAAELIVGKKPGEQHGHQTAAKNSGHIRHKREEAFKSQLAEEPSQEKAG